MMIRTRYMYTKSTRFFLHVQYTRLLTSGAVSDAVDQSVQAVFLRRALFILPGSECSWGVAYNINNIIVSESMNIFLCA